MGEKTVKPAGGDGSDRESENFEDAPETKIPKPPISQHTSSTSVRSLTDRPSSSASSVPTPRFSHFPDRGDANHLIENGTHEPASETNSITSQSNGIHMSPISRQPRLHDRVDQTVDSGSNAIHARSEEVNTKSPLLTARRLSTSSLDEVQLEEELTDASSHSTITTSNGSELNTLGPPPKLPFRSQNLHPISSSPTSTSSPPPPPPKKLTKPFSWLSRGTSASKDTSPAVHQVKPVPGRRNTTTSVTLNGANSENTMSKLEEGNESDGSAPGSRRQTRNSLRDRFKMLRMREEAGVHTLDGNEFTASASGGGVFAGLIGRSTSVSLGIGSVTTTADEKDRGFAGSPAQSPSSDAPPPMPFAPPFDPKLAPGTASGISSGLSSMNDPDTPVDWDLWQSVVYEGPAAVARSSAEELNKAISSGIPSAIRGVIWQVLAQSKNEDLEGVYRDLVARGTDKDRDFSSASRGSVSAGTLINGNVKDRNPISSSASSAHSDHASSILFQEKDGETMTKLQSSEATERKKRSREDAASVHKLEKTIRRDLGARTSYSRYAAAAGLQEGLFGVCKAYALFDESVGYAQGMNFLVMPLLFSMPEEEAFCLLVRLMNQYHLRDLFIQDMPGLHLHLYQFERLLEDFEPALYCHLHRRSVTPQMYATQWFLTLFAYRFPLQLVLRVYDLILSEGLESAILKFGLCLMQKNAKTLLGMSDMADLTNFLKERLFDVYTDQTPSANSLLESGFFGSSGGMDKEVYRADVLVQDACSVKITPELLKKYTLDWNERVRSEKEKEVELDGLRSTNASLTLKVRSLEERNEKSDTEHVQMASELVRTKVENEELLDQNESLKHQVEELKAVVERQPDEVEQRLKEEMNRIMARNLEVQNENRGLEEQMADMEKSLVETKMQLAEINSEHETLKQKWSELRRAIES